MTMPEAHQDYLKDLQSALQKRLAIVADHELRDRDPQEQLAQLRKASGHLDTLHRQFPPSLDGQLAHYLQGGSYLKALDRIEQLLAE